MSSSLMNMDISTSTLVCLGKRPEQKPKDDHSIPGFRAIVDRFVGHVDASVAANKRVFFEKIVSFWHKNGNPVVDPPKVDGREVDLHGLYFYVRIHGNQKCHWSSAIAHAIPGCQHYSTQLGDRICHLYKKYLLHFEYAERGIPLEEMLAEMNRGKRKYTADDFVVPCAAKRPKPRNVDIDQKKLEGLLPPPAGYHAGPPPEGVDTEEVYYYRG